MVSRQESARPLLTPGEVMQLPPSDSIVMISGHRPIRASKLRYYEDRNFAVRVLPPPPLTNARYLDCPKARSDDWSLSPALFPAGSLRTASQTSADGTSTDDGGLEQRPELKGVELSLAATVAYQRPLFEDDANSSRQPAPTVEPIEHSFQRSARMAALDPTDGMEL